MTPWEGETPPNRGFGWFGGVRLAYVHVLRMAVAWLGFELEG